MRPFAVMLRHTVVLNLTTGHAFRGVLWAKKGPLLVLRNAELLEPGGARPVDGEVVVERSRVAFVQVLPQAV